ncbi:AraC family transcriptional regulator [Alkalicoccobacillus porphyridii]|nr:AraC family transcriptional regulator [Alkalicoccobacillus porphyridii]
MNQNYLMVQATQPVQFSSAGRVETTKPFLHPTRTLDSYVLLIGMKGALSITQENQTYHLLPGSTLLLKKGMEHRGLNHSTEPLSYYWFHFYLDDQLTNYVSNKQVLDQMRTTIQEPSSQTFSSTIYIPTYSEPHKIERLTILFNQLLDISKGVSNTYLAASYIMTSLLIELSNQTIEVFSQKQQEQLADHNLTPIIEWMHVHAGQSYSVAEIAQKFNYNANYLSRQFKSKIGMSLQSYLSLVKMTKAKDLLSRTRYSIRSISHAIGIEDEKYFMRLFKKNEGMTPSEFRKAYYRVNLTDLEKE